MNPKINEHDRVERRLDAALVSYPITPLPRDFARQLVAQLEPPRAQPGILRRYLRLYATELLYSTVITLILALLVGWPIVSQISGWSIEGATANWAPMVWRASITHSNAGSLLPSWYAAGLATIILIELWAGLFLWVTWFEWPSARSR